MKKHAVEFQSESDLEQGRPLYAQPRIVLSDTALSSMRENDKLIKLHTDPEQKCAKLGNEALGDRHWDQAIEFYSDVIELYPDKAAYYTQRGAFYMQLKHYSEAMDDFQKSLELEPNAVKTLAHICKAFVKFGDTNNAIIYADRLLQLNLNMHERVQKIRQWVLDLLHQVHVVDRRIRRKSYNRALRALQKALQMAPACNDLLIREAECFALCGYAHLGLHSIRQVKEYSAECACVRGFCHYYINNYSKALFWFRRALFIDPNHEKSNFYYEWVQAFIQTEEEKPDSVVWMTEQACRLMDKQMEIIPYANQLVSDVLLLAQNNAHSLAVDHGRNSNALLRYSERRFECSLNDLYKILKNFDYAQHHTKNFYQILGISADSCSEHIIKAFRQKALQHHPDRHINDNPEVQKQEGIKFMLARQAYEVLNDPVRKWFYDLTLVGNCLSNAQ